MRSRHTYWPGLAAMLLLAGCASLQPELPEARPELPAGWPLPPTTTATATADADVAPVVDVGWQDFFKAAELQKLIGLALDNNRDLRVAVLNVERAREQYRIQRADRVPSLAVGAFMQRGRTNPRAFGIETQDTPVIEFYSVELGVTDFELDLFGRVRDLSEAELQRYFATEEARRSAQLALVAEVATAYLALGADLAQQRIARETLASYEETLSLTEQRYELGAASELEVSQFRAARETARAAVARVTGAVAQDMNALRLLTGTRIDPALLPTDFEPLGDDLIPVPADLPSELLLRRPDVIAAEHRLRAANANIGAARAAFFPSISLTASTGSASSEFSGLFESGGDTWSFVPRIRIPIFEGGRLRAGLGVARADRDIGLAEYEGAIQTGFREVADGLALSHTLRDQRLAQEAFLKAAERSYELSVARYRAGRDSYIVLLDVQRTLYMAREAMVRTRLAEQANRATLYKALGGGWITGQTGTR